MAATPPPDRPPATSRNDAAPPSTGPHPTQQMEPCRAGSGPSSRRSLHQASTSAGSRQPLPLVLGPRLDAGADAVVDLVPADQFVEQAPQTTGVTHAAHTGPEQMQRVGGALDGGLVPEHLFDLSQLRIDARLRGVRRREAPVVLDGHAD